MNESRLKKYTTQFGTRFSQAQKKRFQEALTSDFQELGYEMSTIKGKKLLSKANNVFFGNLKNAKTVMVVPYDTPERKFWYKVPYYPLDGSKTSSKNLASTFVPILGLYAIIFITVMNTNKVMKEPIMVTITSIFMIGLLGLLVYLMTHGIRNQKNFVRHSASIAAALEIAERLSKDERKKVGFLFTDKNKNRFLGADIVAQEFVKVGKSPNIICLDCIGKGKEIVIGYNPQNKKLAAEVAKFYPTKNAVDMVKLEEQMRMQTAMTHYKKAIVIARGEKDNANNLVVMGTSTGKDKIIDESCIQPVCEMVYGYLHTQK